MFIIFSLLPQLSISRLDPLSQVFSLRWTQHQANMFAVFERLLHTEAFTDVTLACDGGSLKCHKIVLAASSDYFQKLFMENSSEHPIVFLKVSHSPSSLLPRRLLTKYMLFNRKFKILPRVLHNNVFVLDTYFFYMLFNLFMVKNNILNGLVCGVERAVFLEL